MMTEKRHCSPYTERGSHGWKEPRKKCIGQLPPECR